jgi:hypothetical protein
MFGFACSERIETSCKKMNNIYTTHYDRGSKPRLRRVIPWHVVDTADVNTTAGACFIGCEILRLCPCSPTKSPASEVRTSSPATCDEIALN